MTPEREPTARAALRAATAAVHERLHHLPVLEALAGGGISRGLYLALLRRMQTMQIAVHATATDATGRSTRAGRLMRLHAPARAGHR